VNGDAMRLEQVFVNLLHNATKFTPEAGRIWLSLIADGSGNGEHEVATVRVRDEGAGIEPDALPHIFELFVQGDRRSERSRSGLGIGLTLARRLVEMHGGTVDVHSAGANKGSEFVVRLPIGSPPDSEEGVAREDVRVPTAVRRNSVKRILIVDDDHDGGDTMRLLLEHSGFEVEVTKDGEAALSRASRFKPDVVLVDIGLPAMDGYEVAKELRKRPATQKALIIAGTGFGSESDIRKSEEAGFDEHMTKPVNLDVLLGRLHALE
jgi:two-component system CheB/CheR fusion protein